MRRMPSETLPEMLAWLKTRSDRRRIARSLYGSIVAQARAPAFYSTWGVPDSVQGRFEMIALHLVLTLRRLRSEGRAGERLARALTETCMVDLDDAMREMTFGDLAVPREVKRAVVALLDRHRAYLAALDAPGTDTLADTLQAQLAYLGGGRGRDGESGQGASRTPSVTLDARGLADYVRKAASALDGQPASLILGGQLTWPQASA